MSLRRRNRARREGAKANIDMNSLIDLTFLLLVVFIVTLPTLEQTVPILLPTDKVEEKAEKKPKIVTATVNSAGSIFVGDAPMTQEDFKALVEKNVAADPEGFTVIIRGDIRSGYGDVYDVFKIAKNANVKHLSVAVQAAADGPGTKKK